MHYLADKKLRHSHVPGYVSNWLSRIVVNHGWSKQQVWEFFSYQNDQSVAYELPYIRNHYWTHPTFFRSSALFSDVFMHYLADKKLRHSHVPG